MHFNYEIGIDNYISTHYYNMNLTAIPCLSTVSDNQKYVVNVQSLFFSYPA